jgi:hypothetical protein
MEVEGCSRMLQPHLGACRGERVPAPVRPPHATRAECSNAQCLDASTRVAPLVSTGESGGGVPLHPAVTARLLGLFSHSSSPSFRRRCLRRQTPRARAGHGCPSHPAMSAGVAASAGLAWRQAPLPEPSGRARACTLECRGGECSAAAATRRRPTHAQNRMRRHTERTMHGLRASRDTRGHTPSTREDGRVRSRQLCTPAAGTLLQHCCSRPSVLPPAAAGAACVALQQAVLAAVSIACCSARAGCHAGCWRARPRSAQATGFAAQLWWHSPSRAGDRGNCAAAWPGGSVAPSVALLSVTAPTVLQSRLAARRPINFSCCI